MSGKYILPISKDISRCKECRYHIKNVPTTLRFPKRCDLRSMLWWFQRDSRVTLLKHPPRGQDARHFRSRASLYNVWPPWGNWPQILHGKSVTGQYVTVVPANWRDWLIQLKVKRFVRKPYPVGGWVSTHLKKNAPQNGSFPQASGWR